MFRAQLSRKGRGSARCCAMKPAFTLSLGWPMASHSCSESVTRRATSHRPVAGGGRCGVGRRVRGRWGLAGGRCVCVGGGGWGMVESKVTWPMLKEVPGAYEEYGVVML
jgi:hypothetical protein